MQADHATVEDMEHDRDQVVVLRNVPWEQYVALADARPKASPRMAYLDGELALMTVSERHEIAKKVLARLLEAYAEEASIDLDGAGNATWRDALKQAGLEADECYFVNRVPADDSPPDLAIEVVLSSGGVDKLEIYRRLGFREVWFWIDEQLEIHSLARSRSGEAHYRKRATSGLLPDLDVEEITTIARSRPVSQTRAVRAYRRALQQRRKKPVDPIARSARCGRVASRRPASSTLRAPRASASSSRTAVAGHPEEQHVEEELWLEEQKRDGDREATEDRDEHVPPSSLRLHAVVRERAGTSASTGHDRDQHDAEPPAAERVAARACALQYADRQEAEHGARQADPDALVARRARRCCARGGPRPRRSSEPASAIARIWLHGAGRRPAGPCRPCRRSRPAR